MFTTVSHTQKKTLNSDKSTSGQGDKRQREGGLAKITPPFLEKLNSVQDITQDKDY